MNNSSSEREEMLQELRGVEHPIVVRAQCYDMGCDFRTLTSQRGFSGMLGHWPVDGPLVLTSAQYAFLHEVLKTAPTRGREDFWERTIDRCTEAELRNAPEGLMLNIRPALIERIVAADWPANTPFYVYKDLQDHADPVIFATLAEVAAFFFDLYGDQGEPWETMSDDELEEWCSDLTSWREAGSPPFPTISGMWSGEF